MTALSVPPLTIIEVAPFSAVNKILAMYVPAGKNGTTCDVVNCVKDPT